MILQEDDLKLVSTAAEDPELSQLLQDYSILKNLTETRSYPQPMPSAVVFRIEAGGRLIGEVSLKGIRWYNRKAQIGIALAPEHQGQGYGERALRAIIRYGFMRMNLQRLEAEVIEYNQPAQKLFEKLGFVLEGRLRQAKYCEGKYYDVLCFGLLRAEYSPLKV